MPGRKPRHAGALLERWMLSPYGGRASCAFPSGHTGKELCQLPHTGRGPWPPLVALKYLSLPLPRDGFDPGLSDSLDQKKPYVLEAGDQRGGLLQEEHLANEF